MIIESEQESSVTSLIEPSQVQTEKTMVKFQLQFDESLIPELANRYSYPLEDKVVDEIGPRSKNRGYFTEADFKALCYWKTPRSQSKVNSNPSGMIEEATRINLIY